MFLEPQISHFVFFVAVGQTYESQTKFSLTSKSGKFSQGQEFCARQNKKKFARIETTGELEDVKDLLQKEDVDDVWIPLKKKTGFTTTTQYGCRKFSKVEKVKSLVEWHDGGDLKVSGFGTNKINFDQ